MQGYYNTFSYMDSLSNPEHDTEDKNYWVKKYEKKEVLFCTEVCPMLHLSGAINPEKEKDPTRPDIVVNGRLGDLKYQSTPFYSAGYNYGYDPQYTVTFNVKDYNNYSAHYPDIDLYYWVDYPEAKKQYRGREITINRLEGIFFINFQDLVRSIDEKKSPVHAYQRRVHDQQGNAKGSYLLDIRYFKCLSLFRGALN